MTVSCTIIIQSVMYDHHTNADNAGVTHDKHAKSGYVAVKVSGMYSQTPSPQVCMVTSPFAERTKDPRDRVAGTTVIPTLCCNRQFRHSWARPPPGDLHRCTRPIKLSRFMSALCGPHNARCTQCKIKKHAACLPLGDWTIKAITRDVNEFRSNQVLSCPKLRQRFLAGGMHIDLTCLSLSRCLRLSLSLSPSPAVGGNDG